MSNKAQTQAQGKDRVEEEKERLVRQGKEVRSKLTPLKVYLLGYNLISALLWGHLLYITILFIVTSRSTPLVTSNSTFNKLFSYFPSFYKSSSAFKPVQKLINHLSGSYDFRGLGWWTKYTQSLAILEVVHAALGWVRSPIGTVAAQVASRLWTVWGVVEASPDITHASPLFTTMLFAWSLTEVIRYTFYFLSILNIQSPILNWLRYTTFIPLYPIGASSEAFLSFSTLPSFTFAPFSTYLATLISHLPAKGREVLLRTTIGRNLLWNLAKSNTTSAAKKLGGGPNDSWGLLEYVRLGLFFIWWPALYVLYTYMFKQRRKVLGKGRGKVVGGANKAR
ncbi:uncharacterized protein IL334_006388 [Kwoniella shivajii]|uniref:Very-long-chain (3R)-3-hydroxyacyl-CoA dehydratase n=1 Tax=Kwoniella shivajii TaxID=564305 RepID=A0ABZ1D7F0_9TREE|nr:hypothetical protein IL334_006388 [Kwoniella shivajii]